jgi:hypothetical protein
MLTIYTIRRFFCVPKNTKDEEQEGQQPLLDPERDAVNTLLHYLGNRSPPYFPAPVIAALQILCYSQNTQLLKSAALAIVEMAEIDNKAPVSRELAILILGLLSCKVFDRYSNKTHIESRRPDSSSFRTKHNLDESG